MIPTLLAMALALAAAGLYLMLPRRSPLLHRCGMGLAVIGFAILIGAMSSLAVSTSMQALLERVIFWTLAAVTIFAALMAVSIRSAVYVAIWFAISLIGVAGLFLFQGAQFLGVVTVVVYAGAIVVMFLFVIMLAQPEGHSIYDRIAWGTLPKFLAVATAMAIVGVLGYATLNDKLKLGAAESVAEVRAANPVLATEHTANLGRELFSRHLISIEIAGTLLLIALVGAVAIAIHGNQQRAPLGDQST